MPHYAMTAVLIGSAILLVSNDIAESDEIDRAWTVGMTLETGPFTMLGKIGRDAFLQLLGGAAAFFTVDEMAVIKNYLAQTDGAASVSA